MKKRTIIIGDIHGCSSELALLLDKLCVNDNDLIIQLGDAFSKGNDPIGVYNILKRFKIKMLLGNHEWGFYKALVPNEGSYKFKKEKYEEILNINYLSFSIWDKFLELIPTLPVYLFGETDNNIKYLTIHAGVNPKEGLEGTDLDTAVAIRHYPRSKNEEDPWWYELYTGDGLIIYGHSAKENIIRIKKKRKPCIMGIDTGCVYGGHLTAYIVEEDKVIQIKARKQYFP